MKSYQYLHLVPREPKLPNSLFPFLADNEPPDIQCPDDIKVSADPRQYLTTISYIKPPRVRDRSDILSIIRMPAQLVSSLPLGSHKITYKVEDVWNNVAQCDVNIQVWFLSIVSSCLLIHMVIFCNNFEPHKNNEFNKIICKSL